MKPTGKEKLIALFTELSIGFELRGNDLFCEEGKEKISGYSRFFTRFEFDSDGAFIQMGAWE